MNLKSLTDNLRKYYTMFIVLFIFCMITTLSFLAMHGMQRSSAATTSGFNAGNIISDSVMANYNSMSRADIQNFLNTKGNCNNTNYNQYLQLKAAYPNTDWHFENGHFVCLAEERFGDGTVYGAALNPGEGQSAADIIYEAAQDYRINPQVLLVLLEKEQSLITDSYPNSNQFRSATGYGCPDTAACSSKYYGFKNQVHNAAAMFRSVLDGGWSNYPAGQMSYIQYNPSAGCGGSMVFIENRATSSLYRYTPYQPNSSALAAGYGTGDICSAYGNRNFYLYFTDWFGNTQEAISKEYLTSIPEGIYGFSSTESTKRFVFDVSGLQNYHGTNVQLWEQYPQGAQRWRVVYNSTTQDFTIVDINSNLNLSAATETIADGVNLQISQPSSSCAQRWQIYQPSDNSLVFESSCAKGMVITATSSDIRNGVNLVLSSYIGSQSQLWQTYIGQTVQEANYKIQTNLNANLTLDVAGLNDSDGANIQLWEDYYGGFQNWHFVYEPSVDSYIITNIESGKTLEVTGASTNLGANIQVWHKYETCGHYWKIIPATDDSSYTIMSACKVGQVIDVQGGNNSFGTNIQLWASNNSNSQKWSFKPTTNYDYIDEGIYVLLSGADNSRAVDVSGLSKTNGANVWLWEQYPQGAQKWQITYNRLTGDYTLTDLNSSKSLSITNKNGSMGNNVVINSQTQASNCTTRWHFNKMANGHYKIVSSCLDNRVVDIAGATTTMGSQIWLWENYSQLAQEWRLQLVK